MRGHVLALLLAAVALLTGAAGAAPPDPSPPATTQLPRTVRPVHYDVAIVPDAAALTFTGRVAITIEVLEPVTRITLNAARLHVTSAVLSGETGAAPRTPALHADEATETLTVQLDAPVPPGRYRLALEYAGTIGTQAAGLFAIDYDTPEGRKRALYTKFEPATARRFLPCWDEPAYRATFALEATVPAAQMAVGNMPVASRTDVGQGRERVRFQTSPAMSTYLFFFAVGDFDRASATVDGIDVGVVTKKGAADQAAFALSSSTRLLHEYNEYFGVPYPLPKLDNVAAPGRSQQFSAMENWGAILTFEYAFLLDPSISTQADKQRSFTTASHEISHQWFGDLVTMRWWDDLWLNEGFASWMEGRTTEKLHPEWNTALAAVDGRERAMARDALATTHPVVQHVETVEQAVHAFDAITYQKGEAVIRMLEGYVGAEAWRDGVRRYVKAHAYGNTDSDDFWRAVEAAAGKPITAIAHEFTLQPGIPLITVDGGLCRDGQTTVTLTQGEFTSDRPGKSPLAWRVPVIIQAQAGEPVRTLVTGSASVAVPGCGPVVVNAGQSGYYRTLYAPPLARRLVESFPGIAPIDQLGLLADAWALGAAGFQSPSDVLDLAQATPVDADPQVWGRIARVLGTLNDLYAGERARQQAFRDFAVPLLAPVLGRLGWVPRADEPDAAAILRAELIETLGALGDPTTIAEARRRYGARDASADAVPPTLRKSILGVVARHADAPTWDALHAAARVEKTPLVKDQLYFLLSSTEDEALARRALDIALTAEPGATTGAGMIGAVATLHPDLAFDYAMAHRSAVDERVDVLLRSRYYPQLARNSADPAMTAKIAAFAAALDPRARREAETAAAMIAYRIQVRRDRLPLVDAWLRSR
jgi:aminopeptidase N